MIFLKDTTNCIFNLSHVFVAGKEGNAINGTVVTDLITPDGNQWTINAPRWVIETALSRGAGFYVASDIIAEKEAKYKPVESRPFIAGEWVFDDALNLHGVVLPPRRTMGDCIFCDFSGGEITYTKDGRRGEGQETTLRHAD